MSLPPWAARVLSKAPVAIALAERALDAWGRLRARAGRKTPRVDPKPFPDLPPRSNATIYEPDGSRRKL